MDSITQTASSCADKNQIFPQESDSPAGHVFSKLRISQTYSSGRVLRPRFSSLCSPFDKSTGRYTRCPTFNGTAANIFQKFVASTNRNKRGIRSNVITFFDRIKRLIKSPGRERARFLKSVFSLKRLITSCLCPPAYAPSPPRYFRRPVKERRLIFASSLNGGAGVISTKNSTSETDFPPRTIEYLE